jgi:hypothetical protein
MGSIACPIDPRCGVTGRQTRLAPVSERATGAGNHGEIPSCACLMGNLIGKFIIMVKWGIEWGISYLTVETTVCLKDQAIGRCRFWFKELTDPNPPLPARWFEGRVKKTMKPESCLWITTGENSMSCHMDKYVFQ